MSLISHISSRSSKEPTKNLSSEFLLKCHLPYQGSALPLSYMGVLEPNLTQITGFFKNSFAAHLTSEPLSGGRRNALSGWAALTPNLSWPGVIGPGSRSARKAEKTRAVLFSAYRGTTGAPRIEILWGRISLSVKADSIVPRVRCSASVGTETGANVVEADGAGHVSHKGNHHPKHAVSRCKTVAHLRSPLCEFQTKERGRT